MEKQVNENITTQNRKKKLSKKSKIIIYLCTGVVSLGVIGTSSYFIYEYLKPGVDYDKLNALELEDDLSSLYDEYLITSKEDYIDTFSPYELANIALLNYQNEENNFSIVKGSVTSFGVTQSVRTFNIKQNNNFFSESISYSSFVKVARRFYQSPNEVIVYSAPSTTVTSESAKYDIDKHVEYDLVEFENLYGKTFARSSIYIISSKTVLDSSVEKIDGGYEINISLDPIKSVIRYVKQMSEMSNLSKEPTFKEINLTYTVDDELNLKSCITHEEYEIYLLGKMDSVGDMVETYHPGEFSKILDLSENYSYND